MPSRVIGTETTSIEAKPEKLPVSTLAASRHKTYPQRLNMPIADSSRSMDATDTPSLTIPAAEVPAPSYGEVDYTAQTK